MKTADCNFSDITMMNQSISKKQFSELMFNLYTTIVFSTFPYTIYKTETSQSGLNIYNSGNCIAICHFVKIYLERNAGVKSYIIPASLPKSYKVKGTPHLSHCAIAIPVSNHEFFIFDGTMYFIKPIYCNLKKNIMRTIELSDIYQHKIESVQYIMRDCKSKLILDNEYKQILNPNSICVSCKLSSDHTENWKYYLNEITNPDENIGLSFLSNRPQPFLLLTEYNGETNKLKYKLELRPDGNISIKMYPGGEIIFNDTSLAFGENIISHEFMRYLSYKNAAPI